MRSIRSKILNLGLGVLVFTAALLGLAGPAAAHDAAESTSPAQGASITAPPERVSVTLNKNPLGIGASMSVKDAAGAEWAEGPVEIVDNKASQRLRAGGPAGQYTVAWRLVSSDSHPIEGTFVFTAVSAAPDASPAASPTAAGTVPSPGAAPGMGTAQPGTTAQPAAPADAGQPFQWSIVIFAAVAAGLLATLAVLARRTLAAGTDEEG